MLSDSKRAKVDETTDALIFFTRGATDRGFSSPSALAQFKCSAFPIRWGHWWISARRQGCRRGWSRRRFRSCRAIARRAARGRQTVSIGWDMELHDPRMMQLVSIVLEVVIAMIAILAAHPGRLYLYGLAFTFAA